MEENFSELLESSLADFRYKEGEIIKGTVLSIVNDTVVVDVGLKSEGRIPLKEFHSPGEDHNVKDGITDWIKKWKLNNWKGSNKKPVKNKDLWIKLDNACLKHKVTWKWVKAHAGNKYNNLADELAVLETKK